MVVVMGWGAVGRFPPPI